MPPTITIPNGIRLVEDAPNDNASGNAPNDMARLVINMGRKPLCGRINSCFCFLHPFFLVLIGKLNDQNSILGYQPYQHDHSYLRKYI